MYAYTCGACQMGNHERCEKGHPAPPGVFGGSRCICRCNGRSKEQWMKDEEESMRKRIKGIVNFERKQQKRNIPNSNWRKQMNQTDLQLCKNCIFCIPPKFLWKKIWSNSKQFPLHCVKGRVKHNDLVNGTEWWSEPHVCNEARYDDDMCGGKHYQPKKENQ